MCACAADSVNAAAQAHVFTYRERRDCALQEKQKGNEAYKKKDFDTAIQHYDRALELYDKDISFLTNRAAVRFEQRDYDAAIADCELAVERGRQHFADFKMIAKCAMHPPLVRPP